MADVGGERRPTSASPAASTPRRRTSRPRSRTRPSLDRRLRRDPEAARAAARACTSRPTASPSARPAAFWDGDLFIAEFGNFFGDEVVGHQVVRVPIDENGDAGAAADVPARRRAARPRLRASRHRPLRRRLRDRPDPARQGLSDLRRASVSNALRGAASARAPTTSPQWRSRSMASSIARRAEAGADARGELVTRVAADADALARAYSSSSQNTPWRWSSTVISLRPAAVHAQPAVVVDRVGLVREDEAAVVDVAQPAMVLVAEPRPLAPVHAARPTASAPRRSRPCATRDSSRQTRSGRARPRASSRRPRSRRSRPATATARGRTCRAAPTGPRRTAPARRRTRRRRGRRGSRTASRRAPSPRGSAAPPRHRHPARRRRREAWTGSDRDCAGASGSASVERHVPLRNALNVTGPARQERVLARRRSAAALEQRVGRGDEQLVLAAADALGVGDERAHEPGAPGGVALPAIARRWAAIRSASRFAIVPAARIASTISQTSRGVSEL